MKVFFLSILTLFFLGNGFGQSGSFTENITKLKVSNSLKSKAITAFNATKDKCWDGDGPVTKDCSDLKDPWGDDSFPDDLPAGTTSPRITAFYVFEREIIEGKGGSLLPENTVRNAWKKHPGFALNAMRERMEIYNLKIDK